MESFEELGIAPELVEELAAQGMDVPTPLQADVIPVLRRGNSLLLRGGPGAGVLVAYGVPLLDRLEPEGQSPRAVVLAPTPEAAGHLAESLARLARSTGHVVAALDGSWVLPERAHILFATPADLLEAVRHSRVKLDEVEALVVDGAAAIEQLAGLEELGTLVELLPDGSQRVVASLPLTPGVRAFADGHLRKAVTLPSTAPDRDENAPSRGEVRYRMVGEPREDALIASVARLLADEARHVMLFTRSDDRAADVGDHLTLHGFAAGPPGEETVPVWLAVDELETRRLLQDMEDADQVATLSLDVPPGADSLDRRHGSGGVATVMILARELPHLKEAAREAGYTLAPAPDPTGGGAARAVEQIRSTISKALDEEVLAPWHVLLEPLYERYAPGEVAAALAAMLHRKGSGGLGGVAGEGPGSGPVARRPPPTSGRPARGTPWVRLFVTVGERDGVGPGDLVGAVTGEAGIPGSKVGKIEVKTSYSLVEVEEPVAPRVIEALNGVTIKGRAARVDYDRGAGGRSGGKPGGRKGGR